MVANVSNFHPGGDDYLPVPIEGTFTSNADSPQCFSLVTIDDNLIEDNEIFLATLTSKDMLNDTETEVTINDNDGI